MEQAGTCRNGDIGAILLYKDVFRSGQIINEHFGISLFLVRSVVQLEACILQELTGIVGILEEFLGIRRIHHHQACTYRRSGHFYILSVFGNGAGIEHRAAHQSGSRPTGGTCSVGLGIRSILHGKLQIFIDKLP